MRGRSVVAGIAMTNGHSGYTSDRHIVDAKGITRKGLFWILDGRLDPLLRGGVNYGPDPVGGILRRADRQPVDRLAQPGQEAVVATRVDDHPGAGGAFLSLVPERGGHDRRNRLVQVGVHVDQDRVLATHLHDSPLDRLLSRPGLSRLRHNPQAHGPGPGEEDEIDLRMADEATLRPRNIPLRAS